MRSFEDLYRQHAQAVFRFAFSVVGNREAAEDLTSEAFLALYRNLATIDQDQLPAWLLAVVRNRARDLWRKRMVEQRYAQQLVDDPPVPAASESWLEGWILGSPELKPIHRTCIILRYVRGMTRGEIAATTGLTETQVKGHLQYALTLLRKQLEQR
jgi:RNA polymerase sigma-70 factor (ECF subfamily)